MEWMNNSQKIDFHRAIEKINNKDLIRENANLCWIGSGAIGSHGYPQVTMDGKSVCAHRYMYWAYNGGTELEKGKHVRHKCDNKICCNPEHLEMGSAKENSTDYWVRQKGIVPKPKKTEVNKVLSAINSGEGNNRAILTWDKVREIRHKRDNEGFKYGELKKMATELGISYPTIQKVVSGETWKET